MTLTTDYILGLILAVGADAYRCMPSLKVESGEPVKYPEIAYAIASTCDTLCKEIACMEMGDAPHDSQEAERMKSDFDLDIETIPTILRDLRVGEIEVSDDDC